MTRLTIAELFAGIGGVTGGFYDAGGFDPVYLTDADDIARKTFVRNFSWLKTRYHTSLVEDVDPAAILEAGGGAVDGVLGCPPCQGLSAAGSRQSDDPRNQLLGEFERVIVGVQPKFFVMENVPSLLSTKLFMAFAGRIRSSYRICAQVLNAAEYGVPQLRRRAVVIGYRMELDINPTLPPPTHGGRGRVFDYRSGKYVRPATDGRTALQLRPDVELPNRTLVTLERAIGDLPLYVDPDVDADCYATAARTEYQMAMRGAGKLENHRGWRHGPEMRRRMATVNPGDCPTDLGTRSRNTRYFSQAYSRLHPDGLARTLTTNFHNPGSGRFTHYSAPRTLTLREALRIQGFPDSFVLDTDDLLNSQAERLVGNAFPRPLARAIAAHVKAELSQVH